MAFGLLNVRAIPGCVSQGETKEEAVINVEEAIQLCLEVRAERGLPLTLETQQEIFHDKH
ncbi:MAG: type II toxin-antitoxin system HicB family antitoxin [Anaerolineales bacterium]|nr:type II toxin-antitoxin system HicB family antitoxin [Anaerolineales bacterium]